MLQTSLENLWKLKVLRWLLHNLRKSSTTLTYINLCMRVVIHGLISKINLPFNREIETTNKIMKSDLNQIEVNYIKCSF